MEDGPFPVREGEAPSEEVLLRRARGGDQDAFVRLWRTAERRAYALSLRLTGNPTDAADALQETQIAAWRNLGRFDGRCPFGAWVLAIARNASLAVLRVRGRRAEVDLDGVEERRPVAHEAPFVVGVVEALTVQDALEQLPERHREALLLWAGGLSYQQVAVLMGASLASVKVWIHRGRARLRTLLGH